MPRWARFLSCSFTCLLLSLTGFLLSAYWWEGGRNYWSRMIEFAVTRQFLSLALLFGLLSAIILIVARVASKVYGMAGPVAGLIAGTMVSLGYVAFIMATHADTWGGLLPGLQRVWPSMAPFVAPFAAAGGFTTWLWERLD